MQKNTNKNIPKIDIDKTEVKIKEELNEEKNKNKLLNSKINELNEKINDLQKITNKNDNMVNTLQLLEEIREKEIKEIKANLPFDISKGEKLMTVIFISDDQKIHYSFICKNTDKFNRLENILYNVEEYKSYLQSENYFLLNGKKINKYLTLEENGIKNSDIITLMKYED
jgi:vacuolar-type H+-ATPase subunit I/STV1